MDSMSLSLDDIIKKNKSKKGSKGFGGKNKVNVSSKGPNKNLGKVIQKKKITPKKNFDARMKLIQKNRQKIIDAREIIAENTRSTIRDARQLISMKKKKPTLPKSRPAKFQRKGFAVNPLTVNDLLIDDEDDEDMDFQDLKTFSAQPISSIRRTVKNDVFRSSSSPPRHMPKLPVFSINNRESSPSQDPFDCYVVPTRRPLPLPPAPPRIDRSFHANKMSAHMDAYIKKTVPALPPSQKGILRSTSLRGSAGDHDDRFESDRYIGSSSEALRSSRYSNESAGIFAKIMDYKSPPKTKGYRIIIGNLVSSVSESDVEELFSEIGELISAKMIKAGTAEVIFKNAGDDERAHDAYHNRLIDGQPMKITLAGGMKRTSASYY